MWKAWRVPATDTGRAATHDARQAVRDGATLPPECRTIALSPGAIVRIHVVAAAPGARGALGGALDLTSSVAAPELVYVPPWVWRGLLAHVGKNTAVRGASTLGGLAWSQLHGAPRLPPSDHVTLVEFLRNVHANERGLVALGDLICVLWNTARTLQGRWPRGADDLRDLLVDENGAAVSETVDRLWAYLDPGRDALAIDAVDPAAPIIPARMVLRAPDTPWPLFLRAMAQGDGTLVVDSAADPQPVSDLLRRLGDLVNSERVADMIWVPGAVLVPERTLALCDALAWGDPALATRAPAPARTLVAPVAACDVPRLFAWLRASVRVAEDLHAIHTLSLARMGIAAPRDGMPWNECRETPANVGVFRARAGDTVAVRAFLRALACMSTIEAALGRVPHGQMDTPSALFVWLVADAVRRVNGQTATSLLPIPDPAPDAAPPPPPPAPGGGGGGGAPPPPPPPRSDAERLLESMQTRDATASARIRADRDARARANQDATPRFRAEADAIVRLIAWHSAFLYASRPLASVNTHASGAIDVLATSTGAIRVDPHIARVPKWMESVYAYASSASVAAETCGWSHDSAMRRYYFCALVCAYNQSHIDNAAAHLAPIFAHVARNVVFEQHARAGGTTPIVTILHTRDHAASMDAFPLPLSYADIQARQRDVIE